MNNSLSILLVEDNLLNVKVVSYSLKKLNCDLKIAYNGAEAVELYKTNDFDVILMDIMMPIMSGFEATQKIREFEAMNNKKRTPIVAVTANTLNNDRKNCLEHDMDEFIPKPFNVDKLIEICNELELDFA